MHLRATPSPAGESRMVLATRACAPTTQAVEGDVASAHGWHRLPNNAQYAGLARRPVRGTPRGKAVEDAKSPHRHDAGGPFASLCTLTRVASASVRRMHPAPVLWTAVRSAMHVDIAFDERIRRPGGRQNAFSPPREGTPGPRGDSGSPTRWGSRASRQKLSALGSWVPTAACGSRADPPWVTDTVLVTAAATAAMSADPKTCPVLAAHGSYAQGFGPVRGGGRAPVRTRPPTAGAGSPRCGIRRGDAA